MDPDTATFAGGVGLAAAVGYAGSCWLWPFGNCRRCDGKGRQARKDGKVHRICRRCKGTGRRLRVGRRLWNWYHRS